MRPNQYVGWAKTTSRGSHATSTSVGPTTATTAAGGARTAASRCQRLAGGDVVGRAEDDEHAELRHEQPRDDSPADGRQRDRGVCECTADGGERAERDRGTDRRCCEAANRSEPPAGCECPDGGGSERGEQRGGDGELEVRRDHAGPDERDGRSPASGGDDGAGLG
ncbi:hypothetical protein [Halobacterium salinarum]|uniref:hypothetical protein n=1 Tax=Halobacterium salinarum TaxID=2242 RepID=UPI0006778A8F|nr:hypothetical protein [Halobacterium salinarum]